MAYQAQEVKRAVEDSLKSGIYRERGQHRAPGTNVHHTHHPVTVIYGRRFPKSYREYYA